MFPTFCRRHSALALFLALASTLPGALAITQFITLSFFFSWKKNGEIFPGTIPYPLPVTAQCDTIHIEWARRAATGPRAVPPYYLQVYTSTFLTPIVIPAGMGESFDWAVPFPPGTIYQICMYDSKGHTGGCQDAYTMIPSTTVANCANVTFPPRLDVEAVVNNGPNSRYGWIEECTDIEVRPKNGTPPYTLTIAPSLNPPYNITGPGPSLNWTVDVSWAIPFFIGVSDSAGNVWSNGLLHSGAGKDRTCLAGNSTAKSGIVSPAAAAGSGVGVLLLGLTIGLGSMFFFLRRRIRRLELEMTEIIDDHRPSRSRRSRRFHRFESQYIIEPFTLHMEDGRHANSPSPTSNTHFSPNRRTTVESSGTPTRSENRIYVVHNDSNVNAPPVTLYHQFSTGITEPPPRYREETRTPPPRLELRLHSPLSGSGKDGLLKPETPSNDSGLSTSTTLTSEGPRIPLMQQPQQQQRQRPAHSRNPSRDVAYTRLPQD